MRQAIAAAGAYHGSKMWNYILNLPTFTITCSLFIIIIDNYINTYFVILNIQYASIYSSLSYPSHKVFGIETTYTLLHR